MSGPAVRGEVNFSFARLDMDNVELKPEQIAQNNPSIERKQKGGFVKGRFWPMCPHSGFLCHRSVFGTLVPVLGVHRSCSCTLVPVLGPGVQEHPPKPPFSKFLLLRTPEIRMGEEPGGNRVRRARPGRVQGRESREVAGHLKMEFRSEVSLEKSNFSSVLGPSRQGKRCLDDTAH